MRRTIDDSWAPGRASAWIAAVMAVGLAIGAAGADGPDRVDRVGQRVVARAGALTLRDDRGASAGVGGKGQVFRVERVNGHWLRLHAEGNDLAGWAPVDEVIAAATVDPSVRRTEDTPHRGFGSRLSAPFRHAESGASLKQAYAAVEKHDFDRALADCDEAIRLDPGRAEAYYLRGNIRANLRQMDAALADFDEAIRLEPTAAMAYVTRGGIWIARGELEKALSDLDVAIKLDLRIPMAYTTRGALWMKKGDLDRALADLDEAIKLDPRDSMAHVNRGMVRVKKKQLDDALADFDLAIRLEPRNARAFYGRADIWVKKGKWDAALAALDESIRLDPQYPRAYACRGWIRWSRGELDRSLADYTEAIRLDPRDPQTFFNRAAAWQGMGRNDQAMSDLDAALRLDPRDGPTCIALAWLLATCPDARYLDGRRAVATATRGCELTGWKDAYAIGTLAAACARAGDFDAAVKWQTKAIMMYVNDRDRSGGEARLTLYRARKPYREGKP